MGIYIYSILSPKHTTKVKLDNGSIMSVAKYVYAYKPYYCMWEKEPRWQILAKARILRMENVWKKFISNGGTWPQGGVITHNPDRNISVGNWVMTWPTVSLPVDVEDTTCNNATFPGKIVEILS